MTPRERAEEPHPESYCHECNGPNVVWFAPNEIWNKVIGSSNGILCPVCFIKRARGTPGLDAAWRIAPEDYSAASLSPARHAELVKRLRDCRTVYSVTDGHSFNTTPRDELEALLRRAADALEGKA